VGTETVCFGLARAGFIGRSHGLAVQPVKRISGVSPVSAEATVLIDKHPVLAKREVRQPEWSRIARICEAALQS
jgi:hypothetical protein